jgi:hypothetical protein
MHFSFNLLRIKGFYMLRALLAHPQEALHKRHLVCCVRIMSLQSCHSQRTLYARKIPRSVCREPPEDEQVMLEKCRGLWVSINWMKSASRWIHYTDILWCTVSKTLRILYLKANSAFEELVYSSLCVLYVTSGIAQTDMLLSHFRQYERIWVPARP